MASVRIRRGRMFSLLVRASFVKCFEFNRLIHSGRKAHHAFYLIPSLRGMCEDVIFLGYVSALDRSRREEFFRLTMAFEVERQIDVQGKFFGEFRPFQAVLSQRPDSDRLRSARRRLKDYWVSMGWPRPRESHPTTYDLAAKQGSAELGILYNYLFRLTSAAVHFSAQGLLRSGWGPIPEVTFSPSNYEGYYLPVCRLYGCLLLVVYFEKFGRFLRPPPKVRKTVVELRAKLLSEPRWPEMVTFEEMNLKPPPLNLLAVAMGLYEADSRARVLRS